MRASLDGGPGSAGTVRPAAVPPWTRSVGIFPFSDGGGVKPGGKGLITFVDYVVTA